MERLLVSTLFWFIWSKRTVPHLVILAEFGCQTLLVWALASIVLFLCRLQDLSDCGGDIAKLPLRALVSSNELASEGCSQCWFAKVSEMLLRFGFSLDRLLSPLKGLPWSLADSLTVI